MEDFFLEMALLKMNEQVWSFLFWIMEKLMDVLSA